MKSSAADIRWQDRARCARSAYNFTPDTELPGQLEYVRSTWCNLCPVRVECLAYALLYRERGYWGGTDTKERTLLGYPRNRIKCPVCRCKALVRAETDGREFQICQSCGLSWTRGSSHKGEDDGHTADDGGTAGAGGEAPGGPGGAAPVAGGEPVQARDEVPAGPGPV